MLEKKAKEIIENSIEMIPIYFKTKEEFESLSIEKAIVSQIVFAQKLGLVSPDESMNYIDYLFFYVNMLED